MKRVGILGVALCLAAACSSSSGGGAADASTPDAEPRPDAANVDPQGVHHNFVADSITMPTTSGEAQALGLDVDGDGGVDNKLGALVAALSIGGGDVNAEVQFQIDHGELLLLTNVQATDLSTAANVGFWAWKGSNPVPAACLDASDTVCRQHLSGSGTFTVAATDPEDALVVGQIVGGKLVGGPGFVTIEVPLGFSSTPLTLELVGVRIDTMITSDSLGGKLAGAVTETYMHDSVYPQLATIIADIITEDCGGTSPACCTSGSSGAQIVTLFDGDGDCKVTLTELEDSSLLTSLLSPDVDLLDAEGFFRPNDDGEVDSTSLGVEFTAVPGLYPLPAGI